MWYRSEERASLELSLGLTKCIFISFVDCRGAPSIAPPHPLPYLPPPSPLPPCLLINNIIIITIITAIVLRETPASSFSLDSLKE